jgi:alpha-galactosidase
VAGGRALDYTNPEVLSWIEGEIGRIIRQYQLDLFRIDHNHSMGQGGTRQYKGYTENLLWRYYDQFYALFDRVRKIFPNVVFQNCAGGGGRLDLGVLQRFHNTEISDWMRSPRALRTFSNLTMALPPEILLRTFGTETPELVMDGDIDLQMRLVMLCRPIFRGIAPSLAELNPWFLRRLQHHLDLFKTKIRPIMLDGLVFHHTPMLPILQGSPWVVLEYAAKNGSGDVIAVFRTSLDSEEYRIFPRGIDRGASYSVRFDNSGEGVELSGFSLVNDGLRVRLDCQLTSELITFERMN